MNRFYLFLPILFLLSAACSIPEVSLESLLAEMTDKSAITYFPKQQYVLKQFSSYDRRSVSPENKDWWANADYTQFIREENNMGRREYVLFDAHGPGAVVRYWMTFAGEGASDGILRIYIDKNVRPEIEGNVLNILSGTLLASEPLASSVSPETDYQRRGHNLYLPLPYSNHCKITYECDAVRYDNGRWYPSIYYNINYRKYEPNVPVKSFSLKDLNELKPMLEKTSSELLDPTTESINTYIEFDELSGGEEVSVAIPASGGAISVIKVRLKAKDENQALRSTVLSVSFDGKESVWVPVGDFFGTGYQLFPSKTWYTEVTREGWMQSNWLMPFKKSAFVKIINYGDQKTDVNLEISTTKYKWKNSSMYFGASWHELNRVHTATDPNLGNHEWHYDVNYVDLKGKGVYAGDALTVFNTADAWWGEGDEKIFVDGEEFPSCIGTGTEDYYGYAWCRPEKFTHPFIAQPTGAGNFHPGMTVNMRYRSLDAIPFYSEISSNIEMWHWVKTVMNYAITAFWYAKPEYETNVYPDIDMVQTPVVLERSQIYKPEVNEDGIIEGENLEVLNYSAGTVQTQTGDYGWSNGSQLWWRNSETGGELITRFKLKKTAKYEFKASLTKAVDYGIIQVRLNGTRVGKGINCFNEDGVKTTEVDLGKHVLIEGENIFSIVITGSDKLAKPGNMVGIDKLSFIVEE